MKSLYIIVEGQTEQEFVNSIIAPYLHAQKIIKVTPVLIRTSKTGRGGFVKYEHLKNDIVKLLKSNQGDIVVTTLVDYFRMPEVPGKDRWGSMTSHIAQVEEMEKCIANDICDSHFIPYIQLHEFEALLFSSNKGFASYFPERKAQKTQKIIDDYPNPENINSTPQGAPSKRLLKIKDNYDKVVEGNLIALEVGITEMLKKCPRFKSWIERLVTACE